MIELLAKQTKVGFDLDCTLAESRMFELAENGDKKFDPGFIGAPIYPMVEKAKEHMRRGDEVVIFTARVNPENGISADIAREAIQKWCMEVFGVVLDITCMKDRNMWRIYDDIAVTVEGNTGRIMVPEIEKENLQCDDCCDCDSLGSQV